MRQNSEASRECELNVWKMAERTMQACVGKALMKMNSWGGGMFDLVENDHCEDDHKVSSRGGFLPIPVDKLLAV